MHIASAMHLNADNTTLHVAGAMHLNTNDTALRVAGAMDLNTDNTTLHVAGAMPPSGFQLRFCAYKLIKVFVQEQRGFVQLSVS